MGHFVIEVGPMGENEQIRDQIRIQTSALAILVSMQEAAEGKQLKLGFETF